VNVTRNRFLSLIAALVICTAFAACSDDDSGDDDGSDSEASAQPDPCTVEGGIRGPGNQVQATFTEFDISLTPTAIAPGKVTFVAVDNGQATHELVLIKGATIDDLTIDEDGLDRDELPDGAAQVAEIEPIPPGQTCTGTFELSADDFVVLCNIVEGDTSHANEGMVTSLTVG
jgi:hypothetical protein